MIRSLKKYLDSNVNTEFEEEANEKGQKKSMIINISFKPKCLFFILYYIVYAFLPTYSDVVGAHIYCTALQKNKCLQYEKLLFMLMRLSS